MKTLLITGATGFTGHFIVDEAIAQNYKVIAAIRKNSRTEFLINRKVEIIQLTINDKKLLSEELKSLKKKFGIPQLIIHNAGLTQALHKENYIETNAKNTENLIENLLENQMLPEKFIFTSSIAAAGPGNKSTMEFITENKVENPVTYYGKSKLMAEKIIKKYNALPWIIVRPTAIYGPGDKNSLLIYKSIKRGLEFFAINRSQKLTFVYVEDFAKAILQVANSNKIRETYNLSDGKVYAVSEFNSLIKCTLESKTVKIAFPKIILKCIALFSEIFSKVSGNISILSRDKLNELTATNWKCDSSKIQQEIGFNAITDLKSGISKTAKWYKENGWI